MSLKSFDLKKIFYLMLLIVAFGQSSISNIEAASFKECLDKIFNTQQNKNLRLLSLNEVERNFQQSDKVVFFDGSQNLMADNQAFPSGEFQPGNTYTAMVIDDQLILGKNILGNVDNRLDPKLVDPPVIGGPGSHITLFNNYNKFKILNSASWIGNSGAIGIDSSGIIYISGYHFKNSDEIAAKKMEFLVKKICPSCTTRITGGKLEEFGSLRP